MLNNTRNKTGTNSIIILAICCLIAAMFPVGCFAETNSQEAAVSMSELEPSEKLGLVITGSGVMQDQAGFNGDLFVLTEKQLETIKDEKSGASAGLEDCWIENQIYASHDNHGIGQVKGYYHYSRVSGLSIKAILDDLGVSRDMVNNCFYYAPDYSGTIGAKEGLYSGTYYFAPGEQESEIESLAVLALYKTTNTVQNAADAVIPSAAERLASGNNVMVYGQRTSDEDTNCRFAKQTDTIAINKAPSGIVSENNNSRVAVPNLMRIGIYRVEYDVKNGANSGKYGLEGVPLKAALEELGIDKYLADYSTNVLSATSASGEIRRIAYSEIDNCFIAWDYTDDTVTPESQTNQLALYTPDGALYSLTGLTVRDNSGSAVTTIPQKPSPSAPTAFKAAKSSYNSIKLTWKKAKGADSCQIYRYNGKTKSYALLKTLSANTTAYTDKSLATNTTYKYKIRSCVSVNGKTYYSGFSTVSSAKPTLSQGAITKLSKSGKTAVKIKWKKIAGANGYQIYRATKKTGTYKKVATVKKGSKVSYTNKKLKKGKTYYYKVRPYRTVSGKKQYGAFSKVKKIKR